MFMKHFLSQLNRHVNLEHILYILVFKGKKQTVLSLSHYRLILNSQVFGFEVFFKAGFCNCTTDVDREYTTRYFDGQLNIIFLCLKAKKSKLLKLSNNVSVIKMVTYLWLNILLWKPTNCENNSRYSAVCVNVCVGLAEH